MVYKISVEIQCGPFSHISHQVTVDPKTAYALLCCHSSLPTCGLSALPPSFTRGMAAFLKVQLKHHFPGSISSSYYLANLIIYNHCFFPIPLPCPSPYKAPFIGLCFDTQKNCYSLLNYEPLKDRGNTWFISAAPALRPHTTRISGNHPPYLKLMWERTETV